MKTTIAGALLLVAFGCTTDRDLKPEPLPTPTPTPAPTPARKPLSCDDARPEYGAMLQAQRSAYEAALTKAKLARAKLEHVWVTEYRDKEPNYGELLEVKLKHHGKDRRALVGMGYDRANTSPEPVDLVTDDGKHLWRVSQNLKPTSTKTVVVDACQWGCFGEQPRGDQNAPDYGRDAWLLAPGHVFEGERVIDFEAPSIVFQPTRTDCSPPA